MPDVLTARADVPTDAPERYAKQLVSHLGRRVEWTTDGPVSTATIAGGTGVVEVGDGVLTLRAQAPDTEALERVQDVLGRHLERFGQRNELVVTWAEDRRTSRTDPLRSGHGPGRGADSAGDGPERAGGPLDRRVRQPAARASPTARGRSPGAVPSKLVAAVAAQPARGHCRRRSCGPSRRR